MYKIFLILSLSTTSVFAEPIFWTIDVKGMYTSSTGQVAMSYKGTPRYPNPSGMVWEDCKNKWIYFNHGFDGIKYEEKYVDRMLSVAISAQKTNTPVRVSIERNSSKNCYTKQVYDLGQ